MDRVMQLVYYSGKEYFGHFTARIIISCSGINIRNLLIDVTLAAPNIPDALQQFSEIAVPSLLQPLIIHGKSFLDIFVKPLGCPLVESCSHL